MAEAFYLAGLGPAGPGEVTKARDAFEAALTANPDLLGAKLALEENLP